MEGGGHGGAHSAAGGAADGGDWRAQLPPLIRSSVVMMLNDTLMKHLPLSEAKSLSEIQKEAVRIEEALYAAATSEHEYMWIIAWEKLSIENQTKFGEAPVNAQVIPVHNPGSPAPGLLPQGCNQGQLAVTPLMCRQAASLAMLLTSSMLQDISAVTRNTMDNGFTRGNNPHDISAAQRKSIYEQQRLLMQQKIQQQQKPPMQQHIQQQPPLLHPGFALSTQQKFSGLQPGQCTVPYFPTKQPITVSRQQQQQAIGQQSIFQHGSVSGALQQESTLPIKVQSYPYCMSTMQANTRSISLEPLPRQKQEKLIRMNEDIQHRQRLLLEMQLQLKAKMESQKLEQAHHSENDVNEQKDVYLLVYLLLSMGVFVAMLFIVYNHWWDLWQM